MQNDDRKEFVALLAGVMDSFQTKISEMAVAVFWDCLKDYPIEDIRVALRSHCVESSYPPRPADIVQRINPKRTPLEAWTEVEDSMSRYGAYRSVRFEDGVTAAVIKDIGGWPWICVQPLDEPWTQKDFERRYSIYASNGYRLQDALPGLHELHNTPRGLQEFNVDACLVGFRQRQIQGNGARQIGSGL